MRTIRNTQVNYVGRMQSFKVNGIYSYQCAIKDQAHPSETKYNESRRNKGIPHLVHCRMFRGAQTNEIGSPAHHTKSQGDESRILSDKILQKRDKIPSDYWFHTCFSTVITFPKRLRE